MQAILTGIYALYNNSTALKAAIPCGLHLDMAPQCVDTGQAYATYAVVSGRPEYWFAGRRFEVLTVDFNVYADTNVKRLTAYSALTTLYDDATPTVTGYSSIIMERTFQQLLREGERNQHFRAIVTYECRFLKT